MQLIDEHAKRIMEECKVRAKAVGLNINSDTLEYYITNRQLTELSAKVMIPTLYDYWVEDVEVVRDKWLYDIFPHNPYETVINTQPAISFYNTDNPDWLNTMIFYHVLAHINFFQNNIFFRNTWDDDFCGQALADKRLINKIREQMGAEKRWVDYVIEFARGVDNLVGYYAELDEADKIQRHNIFGAFSEKADFYFGDFLKQLYEKETVDLKLYYDEIERYNQCIRQFGKDNGEEMFFVDYGFRSKFPEFNSFFERHKKKETVAANDILQHLIAHSEFINKDQNKWMKDVLHVVRRTSMYFQAQIRTKIANEGWASLWHERLFLTDERIGSHEVDFAKVNSSVLVNPRVGFNPYILGMHLFEFIEGLAIKGKLSHAYYLTKDSEARKHWDLKMGEDAGKNALFEASKNFNDFLLVNFLSDDDFQDFVNEHNLFVAGARVSRETPGFAEIYIKSRSGKEYRKMINRALYHPPHVVISEEKAKEGELYLDHIFEGRSLVTRYVPAVLIGSAYLAGTKVKLETTEFEVERQNAHSWQARDPDAVPSYKKLRVLYTCEGKDVRRDILEITEGSP